MKTSLRQTATRQLRTRPTPYSGQHPRRRFLGLAAGAAALPAISRIARAQNYPSRPITMIAPFAAGGATDVVGRVIAERMQRSLGQRIIIENVTGADGSIGVGRAARAKPDGYTINIGTIASHVMNGAIYSLQYDLLSDLVPIAPLATNSFILFARATMPAKDLYGLIAWLKENPDRVSAGIASAAIHLVTALFQKETGTRFTLVPYRGSALARQDLIAGQIDLLFDPPDSLPLMRAEKIRAYAVTSEMRLSIASDLPTFAEIGLPALSLSPWFGLFAPKGTARDIVGKINSAAVEALAEPAVRSRLGDLGVEIFPRGGLTPEALGALVKADAEKWWPIIKELGIKAE